MPLSRKDAIPNIVLYNLRDARGETQEQVAQALNELARQRNETTAITGNQVSRWERGTVQPGRFHSQLLAAHFQVTIADLGLARQRPVPMSHPAHIVAASSNVLTIEDPEEAEEDQRVRQNQQEWLHIRQSMHGRNRALAKTASRLYPENLRLGESGILAKPEWWLPSPIDLSRIQISLDPNAQAPALDGTEDFTAHVRPLRAAGGRYQRYSHAIRDIAKPRLFENRPSWRLVGASFEKSAGKLAFGHMNYFDAMDTCEAIAHETAAVHIINDGEIAGPTWRGLRFRKAIGDPFDLTKRPVLMSINTLTLRRDKNSVSVVLHNRNAANVATSGGIIGVMPAGVFQPSSVKTGDHSADFDLWHNIMREFSEEFLGTPEHDGDGRGADYTAEPLRSLNAAKESGGIRMFCFGLGMGALDLWCGLETAAIIDGDVFDDLFANLVRVNNEGTVMRVGAAQPTSLIPFTREVISELLATDRLAPETAMSLESAWKHRDQLLS